MADPPDEVVLRPRKNPRRLTVPASVYDKPIDQANESSRTSDIQSEQSSIQDDPADVARSAEEGIGSKKTKPCDKSVCAKAALKPTCFASASDK